MTAGSEKSRSGNDTWVRCILPASCASRIEDEALSSLV